MILAPFLRKEKERFVVAFEKPIVITHANIEEINRSRDRPTEIVIAERRPLGFPI